MLIEIGPISRLRHRVLQRFEIHRPMRDRFSMMRRRQGLHRLRQCNDSSGLAIEVIDLEPRSPVFVFIVIR